MTPCCGFIEQGRQLDSVERFTLGPGQSKSISFNLREADSIVFGISVSGGSNDDIDISIRDSTYGADYCCSGRISQFYDNRVSLQRTENWSESRTLTFDFDNSFSNISSKEIIFTYTVERDPLQTLSTPTTDTKSNGGCLIATAAFGSELAPQVQFLREIRDNTVMSTQSGASFMSAFNTLYYSFSPAVADLERQSPIFKEVVKVTITPLLSSLSLLQLVDIDTEEEMLGYGIGIILLNIGVYFIAPAIIVLKLKPILRTKRN